MTGPYVFGRHQPASHTIIHVSDPHFLAGGALLGGRYEVERTFARTLGRSGRSTQPPLRS